MSTRKKVWREVCGSTAIPHTTFLAQSFSSPSSVVIWSASSSSFPLKASPSSCLGVYWLWPGPCPCCTWQSVLGQEKTVYLTRANVIAFLGK